MGKRNGGLRETGWKVRDATDVVFGMDPGSNDRLYDMRSGALLTFFLLLLAGWIPFVGQMVAGYIGGRKSGSPYRGLAATAISTVAVLVILIIALMIVKITIPDYDPANTSPAAEAVLGYLRNMFGGDLYSINYGIYFLTVVFGIVGGVIADQVRKEMSIISRNGGRIPGKRYRQEPVQTETDEPKQRKKTRRNPQPEAEETDDGEAERYRKILRAKKRKEKSNPDDCVSDGDFSRYL